MRLLLRPQDRPCLEGRDCNTLRSCAWLDALSTIAGRWVVHPFLFAVYPILVLSSRNAGEVRTGEMLSSIGVAFLAVRSRLWLVMRLVLRGARKAGLITSLAIAAFASFNLVQETCNLTVSRLSKIWVGGEYIVHPIALLLLEALLVVGLYRLVAATIKDARRATFFLNIFALFLVIFPVSILILVKAPSIGRPPRRLVPFELPPPSEPGQMPDIYYIILDGYARSDVMKDLFNFDNEPFLKRLEQKGFYIARRSTSNYCQTPLSLSSSLNAVYLDDLVKGLGADQTQLSDLIGLNNVVTTLRPLGYKFVTFATGFDPTEHPEADVYSSPRPYFSGFQRMLVDSTPLRQFLPGSNDFKRNVPSRELNLYILDHLHEIARDAGSHFYVRSSACATSSICFRDEGRAGGAALSSF